MSSNNDNVVDLGFKEVRCIVVDLDGTLANYSHRVDFAYAKDWDSFHAAGAEDKVYEDVRRALEFLLLNDELLDLIILTGRTERYREQTMQWLDKYELWPDYLLMRPNDDWTKDGELKVKLLTEHFGTIEKAKERVLFILDDRDSSVEGLRNAGFPVWQVRPSGY